MMVVACSLAGGWIEDFGIRRPQQALQKEVHTCKRGGYSGEPPMIKLIRDLRPAGKSIESLKFKTFFIHFSLLLMEDFFFFFLIEKEVYADRVMD